MEKNNTGNRLHSLDGLRGLALLLVFINHVNAAPIAAAVPILRYIGIFANGVTGVSILFILSGFLMAYLYPKPKSVLGFIQKRYTRIFPLFLTMVSFMLVFSLTPNLFWFWRIPLLILIACCSHVIWVYGVKRIQSKAFSRWIFLGFVGLQVLIGGFYLLWVMRQPAIVFNHLIPLPLKEATIGLVNGTLTLPFGDYIPMLDGVYWSLAAEILFYILYPIILIPLIWYLAKQKRAVKVIFLLTLLPLLGALDIISHHIFVLSMLQLPLFYYFATGIALGYLYRNHQPIFSPLSKYTSGKYGYVSLIICIIIFVAENLINTFTNSVVAPWTRLIFAIPFTYIVALALDHTTTLAKILRSKWLVFLGTISYSLYLSHTAIIHIAESLYQPTTFIGTSIFILAIFFVTVLISSLLFYLLERPYFHKTVAKQESNDLSKIYPSNRSKIVLGSVATFALFSIFVAFQSSFNFFSLIHHEVIPQSRIVVVHYPEHLSIPIVASQNNFGVLSLVVGTNYKIGTDTQALIFKIKKANETDWLTSTTLPLDEFKGVSFPFGFPQQTDSKGQTYLADFSLVSPSSHATVTLDTGSIQTVYQLQKSTILRRPSQVVSLITSKIVTVFSSKQAVLTFLLMMPFLLLSLYLLVSRNRTIS